MNLENSIIFTTLIFVNLIFYFTNNKIANYLNLFDIPDKTRKIHSTNVPLTGGLFLFANIFLIFFFKNNLYFLGNTILNFNLLLFISIIFFFGIVDDKFGIDSNLKLFLSILIYSSFLFFNEEYILYSIVISTGQNFYLGSFAIPFTVFCLVIFQNAFNMYDGINLQNILFFIFLFLIITIYFDFIDFYFFLIPVLLVLVHLNYKTKIFLGDSGSYILSFLISLFLIHIFNNTEKNFTSDLVFLFLCIPGYDLLRLAIYRMINKKHPFKADKNHIHHLLIKKIGYLKTIIYLNLICFVPILLSLFFKKNIFAVLASLIIYISTIIYLKNEKSY